MATDASKILKSNLNGYFPTLVTFLKPSLSLELSDWLSSQNKDCNFWGVKSDSKKKMGLHIFKIRHHCASYLIVPTKLQDILEFSNAGPFGSIKILKGLAIVSDNCFPVRVSVFYFQIRLHWKIK